MQDGLTQSAGAQGALGLLCSGGGEYNAWAGLVSFLFFFADALFKKKMWVGSTHLMHVIVEKMMLVSECV